MLGLLPPSSSDTFFRLPAAAFTMSLPTSVEPVKAILSTSGWAASAAPAVSPKPVTTLTTPVGKPASAISSPSRSAVSGVCSAGLSTTVQPVRQRRAELPRGHQQREIPRDDLAAHAHRLAQRVGVPVRAGHVRHRDVDAVALELGGGHVVEHVGGERHVGGGRPRTASRCPGIRAAPARRCAGRSGPACGGDRALTAVSRPTGPPRRPGARRGPPG